MRADLPGGRVALLLTDIEGSTRLLHRHGAEGYARLQAGHRDVLRAAFRAEGGVEVDTQGDAFFYVFPDTLHAVRGAVAGTRALARHPWPHDDTVRVRMGLHCGTPQPTEEGYVGLVVNTAARISAVGHGGQILLSAEAAGASIVALAGLGLTLKDLGSHRLKDLDEPQHLFQIVIPELPSDFPPPRSLELRPNNLPASLTEFIGRAELVAEVRDLLEAPGTRVVSLLGPGGTGKSRLGLEVARQVLHGMADGAWFVGLAPVRDTELVLPAIATALGIREEPSRPLSATLGEALAARQMLVLLDNFEQVSGAARAVGQLLAASPGLKLLVTTRQPLRLKGERRVPVPPMALPAPDAPLDHIAASEAVRLFVETAQEACRDFTLTADNAPDVVAICRRVDGLPLAIELATAKLATMSIPELLSALDNRLHVLDEGSVDLLDHQQTLRDLIAWSYDLLEPDQQRLWRRLAVFVGGGTLAAVQAVCDPDGEFSFPRDVDNLVTRSMVNLEFDTTPEASGDSSGKRAVMLETLREYAAERLRQTDEADRLQRLHARWFRDYAEQAAPRLRGPEVERWLDRLDRDLDNFRAAIGRGLADGGSVEDAVAIAGALWFYFYERGLLKEGCTWLERAAGADAAPQLAARAALGLASLQRVLGDTASARDNCEQALATFRRADDPEGTAEALGQLGAILEQLGELETAEACLTESVSLLRQLDKRERLAFSLVALGVLLHLDGDLSGAERHYQESLEIGRELGDRNTVATALVNLGEVKLQQNALAASAALLGESLGIYHELGVRNAVAYCLELLAGIAIAGQGWTRGATLLGAADHLRRLLEAPVESFNQARYQRDLAAARSGAGAAAFEAAWAEGAGLPLAEVIELARQTDG